MDIKPTLREIALFGILGALTFGLKLAMAFLPNIEPVSLLVLLFAVVFGWKALYPTYLYVGLEILFYGINTWNIYYLYVWAVLAFAAWCFRNMTNPMGWAVLSGMFGLFFGVLCAPVYLFTGGIHAAIAWWISGIPYDLIHCVSNFVMALILFSPLRKTLERLIRWLPVKETR